LLRARKVAGGPRDYAQFWAFYERGDALARGKRPYLPEAVEEDSRQRRHLFTADFFAARAGVGAPTRDPIFIVGLPRSGSTMLEQILASHPEIDGTQELYDIPRIVAEFGAQEGVRYPELLRELDPPMFERLGLRYLDDVHPYRRGRPRFLDKMPNNFWYIGLIHLIQPNAVIIDIRRHPMAVCVSNYRQFYARGHNFCYSIEGVAHNYRTYLEVMRHWNEILPGRVYPVGYEELVDDLALNVRRILDNCGLEFDPACLEFHRNRRIVSTPSSAPSPRRRSTRCRTSATTCTSSPKRSVCSARTRSPN
jgi:hypothetical protein